MVVISLIISVVVAAAVIIHYEFLQFMSVRLSSAKIKHRSRIVSGVLGALTAHEVEV
ncbi:MAG: hypothetical protein ACJA0N_000474 [Pseudohongiellaceae bacterium]|jgi:hypothetical protein